MVIVPKPIRKYADPIKPPFFTSTEVVAAERANAKRRSCPNVVNAQVARADDVPLAVVSVVSVVLLSSLRDFAVNCLLSGNDSNI